MRRVRGVIASLLAGGLLGAGCAPPAVPAAPGTLIYLGQKRIRPGAGFDGTVIGGLSALSYDAQRDQYYVLSDDRSAINPARFYTVRLSLTERGIDDVTFTGTHPLLDTDGKPFRPLSPDRSPPVVPPDPEGLAFDATRQRLYWSSEGERRPPVLADPWVRTAGPDGAYLGAFALPPGLAMSDQPTGPRRNSALEGLTLTPDARSLFAAMEQPCYDDGEPPGRDRGALTRITQLDVETGAPVAQYAYPLEAAGAPAKSNGLTDLVALSESTFLVLERAGARRPVIRIFYAETTGATDTLDVASLTETPVTAMSKKLAIDLTATPGVAPLDNVEGITLGPRLPDGRQSVVLVSDDNFSPVQITQFLLLAIPS